MKPISHIDRGHLVRFAKFWQLRRRRPRPNGLGFDSVHSHLHRHSRLQLRHPLNQRF